MGAENRWVADQCAGGTRRRGFVVFSAIVGEHDPTRMAAQVVSGIGFLGAGIILREGINVHGLNTAATLWCSAMVGTFCGGGFWALGLGAAALVVATNLFLRPLLARINRRPRIDEEGETQYTIEITCKGPEEAHTRSLLLHALSEAGLGLRRLDSEDIPDTSKVSVTAQAVASKRNDGALERVVGRLSMEPHVSGATWQVDRTIPDS
jgi:putative Mg2+ transporter-C (MgtC) family protein